MIRLGIPGYALAMGQTLTWGEGGFWKAGSGKLDTSWMVSQTALVSSWRAIERGWGHRWLGV